MIVAFFISRQVVKCFLLATTQSELFSKYRKEKAFVKNCLISEWCSAEQSSLNFIFLHACVVSGVFHMCDGNVVLSCTLIC